MILHANWLPDSAVVSFWLENEQAAKAGVPSNQASKRGESPVHPFCVPAAELLALLPEQMELFEEDHTIRLVTHEGMPIASTDPVPQDAQLVPWSVETGETLAECFFEHILLQGPGGLKPEGVEWGESLRYWYELCRFGRLLYENGAYAPAVCVLEGKAYPSWQAIFATEAEEHWKLLVRAMPPVCRALVDSDLPLHEQPAHLALSFVDTCIDTLARYTRKLQSPRQASLKRSNLPLHRQWLNTLKYGQLQTMSGNPAALQLFAADVQGWTDYMRPACFDMPWRLAFDLVPPEVEVGTWQLRYGLISVRSTDQKLTASQIWSESTILQYAPMAREVLMGGLGQALEVFPQIKASLMYPEPIGLELASDEASEFMSDIVPKLRRCGFIVNLPKWWESPSHAFGLKLQVEDSNNSAPDRNSFLGINNLVDYKWEVALGDETLDEEEFRGLAESKQKLIFRTGKWYRLNVDALNRSLDFIEKRGTSGRSKLNQVLKMTGELQKAGGLPVIDFEMNDGVHSFGGDLTPGKQFEVLDKPVGFIGEMPTYQLHGFSWMVFVKNLNLGACLADDMGLGKTIQMIAVLVHELNLNPQIGPTLIVCPMSVVGNWTHELKRFSPHLKVMVHHGTDREEKEQFLESADSHNVVISTYNLVVRDKACFKGVSWENIVLDEAQNIKNPTTKQATVIRSLNSTNRFCLTGTPIENRLTELWSLMDFLNSGYLGTIGNFRSAFSQPIERDQDTTRARILQRIIRPFILRRLKSDKDIVRDLPEKSEMKVFCNLTTEQAGLYQAVVDEMMNKIRSSHGIERKGLVLSTLTKLKQITNHPAHFLRDKSPFTSVRSGKLQRLEEMLEVVLEAGDKALIFSQFTEIGEAMRTKLQNLFGVEVLYMHGGTSKNQRDEMVHRFQKTHGPRIFLLSLKAGGVGLNLTAANHVFHFDRWWNPAIEDQATDRTYRIGQEKNVQVHKYICVGTVEEKIDQMIEEKKRLAEDIVTPGEQMLTELSTDELQEIFALTHDAVVE